MLLEWEAGPNAAHDSGTHSLLPFPAFEREASALLHPRRDVLFVPAVELPAAPVLGELWYLGHV